MLLRVAAEGIAPSVMRSGHPDNKMIFANYWWLMIPGLLLGLYAQARLMSAYKRYGRIRNASGLTGAQAAREILDQAGLYDVPVRQVGGHLTDHYDPAKRGLFLSSENFQGNSIAAVGIAAHEAGHALQHQTGYALLQARMSLVPITQFASYAWSGIILLGFVLGNFSMFLGIAIAIFTVLTLFQLITLPVEFDASRRAKERLFQLGLVHSGEREGVSRVLNAAAMTYVAAMVAAVLQLLQLVLLARNRDN